MTIQAQPATIFSQLLEQVVDALVRHDTTDFQLKRLEREATKLDNASHSEALEIKAYLAAIRRNADESDRLYSAALRCTNDYAATVTRYLGMLATTLRHEKLLTVFRDTETALDGNPEIMRIVEGLLAGAGLIISARKLALKLSKMGSYSAAARVADSEFVTQKWNLDGCRDEDFGAPVAFAKRFLMSKNVALKSYSLMVTVSDESDESVFFQMMVDQTPQDAVRTEMDLFDALEKESFPLELQGKIVFGLVGTRAVLR